MGAPSGGGSWWDSYPRPSSDFKQRDMGKGRRDRHEPGRTLDRLERARRAGKQLGSPSVLDRRTKSRVQRLKRSGHSIRAIADQVELSVGTVHSALR